jgi:hypothetical protein
MQVGGKVKIQKHYGYDFSNVDTDTLGISNLMYERLFIVFCRFEVIMSKSVGIG